MLEEPTDSLRYCKSDSSGGGKIDLHNSGGGAGESVHSPYSLISTIIHKSKEKKEVDRCLLT